MQDSPSPKSVRPAGRPATIDPEAVAAVALRLFVQRGYEAVSMDDVASAAGIGRKSLYRYFPSKATLVWGGFEAAVAASHQSLSVRSDAMGATGVLDVLYAAVQAAARSLPDLAVTRGRLRLIAEHAELGAYSVSKLSGQQQAIEDFLCAAGLVDEDAHYVSAAFSAALFAGWLRWAQGNDPDPLPHLQRALAVLRIPGQ